MWLSLSLWLPVLACLAQAAKETGHLIIYERETQATPNARTISPETARLIIASRMGVDHYHSLGKASTDELDAVNDFAASQQVFSAGLSQSPVALLLARSEDLNAITLDIEGLDRHDIPISPFPSIKHTDDLVVGLAAQVGISNSSFRSPPVYMKKGMALYQDGSRYTIERLADTLAESIAKLARQDYTVLVLVTSSKASPTAGFGSYVVPFVPLPGHTKRQNKEAPLADFTHSSAADSTLSTFASSNSSNSTGPLRGILPQCFSTLSTCQALTRNCTGHGKCVLKYTDKDASSSGAPCYSCSCGSEVRTNKDGTKKTTVWGGPACQKKDVVAPFWLLAGFTVFLVSLTSWGIGMLYSMGSEELPSVIGAGVSGPPRRS